MNRVDTYYRSLAVILLCMLEEEDRKSISQAIGGPALFPFLPDCDFNINVVICRSPSIIPIFEVNRYVENKNMYWLSVYHCSLFYLNQNLKDDISHHYSNTQTMIDCPRVLRSQVILKYFVTVPKKYLLLLLHASTDNNKHLLSWKQPHLMVVCLSTKSRLFCWLGLKVEESF